jgi:hypothetical protein
MSFLVFLFFPASGVSRGKLCTPLIHFLGGCRLAVGPPHGRPGTPAAWRQPPTAVMKDPLQAKGLLPFLLSTFIPRHPRYRYKRCPSLKTPKIVSRLFCRQLSFSGPMICAARSALSGLGRRIGDFGARLFLIWCPTFLPYK